MTKLLVTLSFLAVFFGFCFYRMPQIPKEAEFLGSLGVATDSVEETTGFIMSDLIVSASIASGVWWVVRKRRE